MFIEAIVTSVDMEKGFCRCKDIYNGGTIQNVRWITPLGEGPCAPEHGEQVFIVKSVGGGYWILGGMSLTSSFRQNSTSMLDGVFEGQVNRNITTGTLGYSNVTNTSDHIPGDAVLNGRGGSFIAALLGGVALFKASPTAQIIASKIGGFVKVFALNFQRFTDAASHEERNVAGRTFTRQEVFDSQANARSDTPKLVKVSGDVAAGTTGEAKTNVVDLVKVQTARDTTPLLLEETYLDGHKVETTQNADTSQKTVVTRTLNQFKVEVTGSGGSSTLILNSDGTTSLNSSASVSVTTPTATFSGNVRVEGSVSVANNVSLDSGVTLATHKHADPQGGQVGPAIP